MHVSLSLIANKTIFAGGSGGSSGYHSSVATKREREDLSRSHVEFEDSEEEAGETVVTGGLRIGGNSKMPADGLTSSISSFLR